MIPNKYAFRMVQNGQIDFERVEVGKGQLMPGADSYKNGVENVIKHSRLIVIWNTVGGCMGVYNLAYRHLKALQKAGALVTVQQMEKLGLIMGEVQAMLLTAWRLTELSQKGRLATATVGMFKAWTTSRGRHICTLGRDVVGGLTTATEVMKMLLDMEILYTYEGSYDINTLLAGSQLTGIKAFI
jgi:acyl-CoA oxidase